MSQLISISCKSSSLSNAEVVRPIDKEHIKLHEQQYQWDAFGNPQSTAKITDTANNNIIVKNDQLHRFAGTDYRFDDCGNQTALLGKGNKQQRVYNALNQLKQLNHNGKLTQYEYDALGRRSAKITEAGRIDFIWDNNQLIGEHQNGKYIWYVYQPDTFLPIALIKNGKIYYYHLDQLGTPICLTDSNGAQVWRNDSDAFGYSQTEKVEGSEEQGFINTVDNPLRFQGQYFDSESNLHYNCFRYYCPKQQRFINQDPIGLVGGINHYSYAPNPVNWVDPFGLSCKEGDSKPDFYVGPSGPDSTLPYKAYRYDRYLNDDGTQNKWGKSMINNKEGQVTYFGFAKFETGALAADAFQIKTKEHIMNPANPADSSWSDARLRGEFDTLQLYNDEGAVKARVPREFGDKLGAELEPLTTAYPEYGSGGTQQLHADRLNVKYKQVDILPGK